MFEAEADGLKRIASTHSVMVPIVYCSGISEQHSFLAMQQLHISSAAGTQSHRQFGRALAKMHQNHASRYGAGRDNYIGTTAQINQSTDNWFDFWRQHRLYYQLNLAQQNGAQSSLIDDGYELGENMHKLFDGQPPASCLHGDLWSGNQGFDLDGNALIFDPAHYYGDRETDIAMTRLFGSAHPDFYAAYDEAYPLSDNYSTRETFYNIYHILNHYNLFGGTYLGQAQQMIRRLLSDIR